jgi:uncharacterized protein (DUF4415 family)
MRAVVTLKIELEVLHKLQSLAKKGLGKGRYQTLINEILTEYVERNTLDAKVVPVKELEKLLARYR